MEKLFHKLSDHRAGITTTYKTESLRGYLLGWSTFEDCFSIVLGYPLIIYGLPGAGKSQVAFEIMIQMSELYGATWVIGSPETGSPQKVFEKILQMVAMKDLTKDSKHQMSQDELLAAQIFVEEHFFLIDVEIDLDRDMGFREFYENVDKISKDLDKPIWGSLLDTFDDIDIDWNAGARDTILKNELKFLRKVSKKTGRCNIIVAHVAEVNEKIFREGKFERPYFPLPHPHNLIHGKEWFRRSFTMLGVWRPPDFLKDENGQPYEKTSTVIAFGKRKPEYVFKKGDNTKVKHIFYDVNKHRYYVKDILGNPEYAGQAAAENRARSTGFCLREH